MLTPRPAAAYGSARLPTTAPPVKMAPVLVTDGVTVVTDGPNIGGKNP